MKTIINYLRSEACVFIALGCIMLVQITHNAFVVYATSTHKANALEALPIALRISIAVLYAFAIEASILTYVLRGMRQHAAAYAMASFVMNLFYYYMPESPLAPFLISAMIAFSIWSFSDMFKREIEDDNHSKQPLKDAFKDKPFKCNHCDKSFETAAQLNGHISVHKRMNNIIIEEQGVLLQ